MKLIYSFILTLFLIHSVSADEIKKPNWYYVCADKQREAMHQCFDTGQEDCRNEAYFSWEGCMKDYSFCGKTYYKDNRWETWETCSK